MKKIAALSFLFFGLQSYSQQNTNTSTTERPKLVVGIAVDQMRWDYLYRYYDRYGSGGFKRLISEGFSCENNMINYLPSLTAVGHTSMYTGSVPAIDGITGNDWIDQLTGRYVYCTSDSSVNGVGTLSPNDARMSPRNMWVTTVSDELRLATNFQSRVVGVSLKDRASILPAGHAATAAFWLDDASGRFVTSSYYMDKLPDWVTRFNNRKRIDSLIANEWNPLYPITSYVQSDSDNQSYEGLFPGEQSSVFPHLITKAYAAARGNFRNTPFGNTITLEFSKEVLNAYQLGNGPATDLLAINFASTDAVGHMYGANSIEIEDTYLRLDRDLADLFQSLDAKVGKGKWLAFLSADHGVAHNIGYMQKFRLPADYWAPGAILDSLNRILRHKFQSGSLVRSMTNSQVNFDHNKIVSAGLDFELIKKTCIDFLQRQPGISFAVDIARVGESSLPEPLKKMISNSYQFKRSGSIQIILNPGWFESLSHTGTTHSTWNPYDTHIPLIWYGWKIKPGKLNRTTNMTDIAPTLAALLHIQMPNGSVGNVIEELVR